jgi:hypothetical protein
MIPASHHGAWRGPNRLWLEDPATPERSQGTLEASSASLSYTWSFRGAEQTGKIALSGPAGSLRANWTDTFHAKDGMVLHGRLLDGEIVLYGTYGAGEGPDWGWRIEIDGRDPEHLVLRMFNLEPEGAPAPAVDLRGAR